MAKKNRFFNYNGELLEVLSDTNMNREYRVLKVRPALRRANNLPEILSFNVVVWELQNGERDRGVVTCVDGALCLTRDYTGQEHSIPLSDIKEVWEDGQKLWSAEDYVTLETDHGLFPLKFKIKH
jgi:hypothetical protein